MTIRRRWRGAAVPLLAGLLMLAVILGQIAAQETPVEATATPAAVVREVLSRGVPVAGGGDALELVRYTIPPDMTLPAHTHPGMQVAWIESGTLYYAVVRGGVPLHRDGDLEAPPEIITPVSGEVAIEAGDAFVEPEGVEHFGRSGSEPVVILVASLFDPEQPPALLATLAATPMP